MLRDDDMVRWWELRAELFPAEPPEQLRAYPGDYEGNEEVAFVWETEADGLGGFVEASIRRYADGCSSSPVGFLEAWYVVPELRRRSGGRALLAAAEDWVRSKGCTEMGSDTWADDEAARAAHRAVGFTEVEVAVHFAKSLGEAEATPTMAAEAPVTLRPVTAENVRAITDLDGGEHQQSLVAPNAVSLAQAYVADKVWTRGIYAGEEPVGFVMLSDDDNEPRYYLWRFMIDHRYQGTGFGRAAMELVEDYVRTRPGGDRLYLSHVPVPGGPGPFYAACGYEDTGREHGGELEMVKLLG